MISSSVAGRGGTIETLMTVPISETEVVLGKFAGAFAFFLMLVTMLLVYPIVLSFFGSVDVRLLLCNYIGLMLLGALYTSVGLFFSACTKHQIVAVILGFTLLALATFAADGLSRELEGLPHRILQYVSIRTHFFDFVRGMLDLTHVVFFVTTTGVFLFLTVKRLEMRRWQ